MSSTAWKQINDDPIVTNIDNPTQLTTALTLQCSSDLAAMTLSKVCGSDIISDMLQGNQLTRRYISFLFMNELRKTVRDKAISM